MQVNNRNRDRNSVIILGVMCAVLQLALAPNVALGNGRANFALIFAACIALAIGGRLAVLAGFFAGIFFDLSTTGPIGLMAFCLTVTSYALGLEGRNRLAGDFGSSMAQFCAASLAVSLAYHLAMLVVGQASSLIDAVIFRTLPTALLTIVCFVPFAVRYSRAQSSGPNLGGGHGGRRGGGYVVRGL